MPQANCRHTFYERRAAFTPQKYIRLVPDKLSKARTEYVEQHNSHKHPTYVRHPILKTAVAIDELLQDFV